MAIAAGTDLRFIGRQAILDNKMQVYGHEILFRSGTDNFFVGDGEHATNSAIDSCLSMIACSASPNLFINCTRESLVRGSVKVLPSRTVILEVLETVPPDAEVIKACKQLKHAGFRLAMDDFMPDEGKRELVAMADFIKVDFRSCNAESRKEIYGMCRNKKISFVAEKVETQSEVETAKSEGNTFFQGYFYSRPEIISEAQIPANKLTYLQMFAALAHPDPDFREIERLLLLEPSLCYRLLRLANSALYGFRYRISTIQAALIAVGEDAFRKLVTIILAGKLAHSSSDLDVRQALERAHFCESLASPLKESPAELYMLGMLSMMDRMLNIPMAKLLGLIYLSSRIEEALLGSQEGIGKALEICKYHERGGDGKGPPHSDPLIRNSAANYFQALLAAGNTLNALHS